MKALSVRQPWIDAILYGGKRIENRLKWKSCHHRGPLLLHAAKGYTLAEYDDAVDFMHCCGIAWRPDMHPRVAPDNYQWTEGQNARGAIVGVCDVIDVIYPGGKAGYPSGGIFGKVPPISPFAPNHPRAGDRWYMGGFALVLDNVRALAAPVPWRGMLGLFDVDTTGIAL